MSEDSVGVIVYSADAAKRKTVMEGVGLRPGKNTPKISWIETATGDGVVLAVKDHAPAVMVLDADAPKDGGMSVAKRIQNEVDHQPVFVLLTARPQDDWLAKWAGAVQVVQAPYKPQDLQEAMVNAFKWVQ